ncbi:MAG: hypothetical protein LBN34_00530, partial [Clostridiales Family XIII bacterium]|nr:hypothetical protein [Clostridiales Family XIII bacterium]
MGGGVASEQISEDSVVDDAENAEASSEDSDVNSETTEKESVNPSTQNTPTELEDTTSINALQEYELTPMGLGGGSVDVSIQILKLNRQPWETPGTWDYIADYAYITDLVITPESAVANGTKRTVTLTAPDGMRFIRATNFNSAIQSITYKNVGGISDNQAIIELKDSVYGDAITVGFTTVNRLTSNTTEAKYTPAYIGKAIRDAGMAGESRPKYTTTVDYKEGSIEARVSETVDAKIYEQDNIFDGFYFYTHVGPAIPDGKQPQLAINEYGEIGQKNALQYEPFYETERFFYLSNYVNHEPYWNLSLKIYIPDGIEIGPNGPYDKVQIEAGTGKKYILWSDINGVGTPAPEGTKAAILSNMENPLANSVKGQSSGDPSIDIANYLGESGLSTNAVFGCDLDLQLVEPLLEGKVYVLDMVIGYTTTDPLSGENAVKQHDLPFTYNIVTGTFDKVDKYMFRIQGNEQQIHPKSSTFDLPEKLPSVNTIDWYQYVQISNTALEAETNDN